MTTRSATSFLFSVAMLVVMGGGIAYADGLAPSTEVPRSANQIPARAEPGGDGVAANGRCGGVSFGTGATRCGDLDGGPSGGISARN